MIDLDQIFCDIDDFNAVFEPQWKEQLLQAGEAKRCKGSSLSLSEVMTIIIAFHSSNFRTFKHFYTGYVMRHLHGAFPHLVSYSRMVELMLSALIPLCSYLCTRQGRVGGISFIDSTPIIVCHPQRAHSHKLFAEEAKWGKNSVGWFYGFKLHLIISDEGESLAVKLIPANVDDRTPVPDMTHVLFGKLFGDKGYISQIEHTRHRSVFNFMVNLIAGLTAYTYQDKKPSLNLRVTPSDQLPILV